MLNDLLIIKPHHLTPAREIVEIILSELDDGPKRYVLAISGETGSGKSTLAMAIKHFLKEKSIKSFIFHMDDYFHLPPTSNHLQRLEDINYVGSQEVNLELMAKHICQVKKGLSELHKPFSHHKENEIRKEIVNFDNHKVILVEGNYSALLDHVDKKIFIDRPYMETLQLRKSEGKGAYNDFEMEILQIQHEIIKDHKKFCDLVLNMEYEITKNPNKVTVED